MNINLQNQEPFILNRKPTGLDQLYTVLSCISTRGLYHQKDLIETNLNESKIQKLKSKDARTSTFKNQEPLYRFSKRSNLSVKLPKIIQKKKMKTEKL